MRTWRLTLLLVLVGLLVVGLSACGDTTTAVRTVTVTRSVPVSPAASSTPRVHHVRHTARAAVSRTSSSGIDSAGFVHCDRNIQAKAATTTCPFAENAFYEYWQGAGESEIRVYSPARHHSYDTQCTPGEAMVVCTTDDGGAVKFSQASVDRYTSEEAAAYASSPNLRHVHASTPAPSYSPPDYTPPPVPSSPPAEDDPNFCDTHDCIPNYPNGNGYTVQCADGTYSDSGGIQGACSHHGGVG
jgi:hypothetical protein